MVDAFAGELTPEALNATRIAASLMAMNSAEQALATPRAQAASWEAA